MLPNANLPRHSTWNRIGHLERFYDFTASSNFYQTNDAASTKKQQQQKTQQKTQQQQQSAKWSNQKENANFASASVVFTFDISPLVIERRQVYPATYELITSLCAIFGGVYTVMGFLDSSIFYTLQSMEKKRQLGKLSWSFQKVKALGMPVKRD